MKLETGIKTLKIGNDEMLHFWYANNKGNSGCNVTIIRTRDSRATCSKNQTDVIAITKTGHWAGNINFSAAVKRRLGLT